MKLLPGAANSVTNWMLMVQTKLTPSERFVPPGISMWSRDSCGGGLERCSRDVPRR